MIDQLNHRELKNLIDAAPAPAVSIYMPTVRGGAGVREHSIRFGNLLHDAQKQLLESGATKKQTKELLESAERYDNNAFWNEQADGLAMFLAAGTVRYFRLPLRFDELVVVSDAFHVKPLFRLLDRAGTFYVLALSQRQVRLLEGTQYGVSQVELKNVPADIGEVARFEDPEKHQQYHTESSGGGPGQSRPAIYHGQNESERQEEIVVPRFLRMVEAGVTDAIGDSHAPLILAAGQETAGIYRSVNHYDHLIEESIVGNVDHLNDQDIWKQAWPIAEKALTRRGEEVIQEYESYASNQPSSDDIAVICERACQAGVDLLLVRQGDPLWGVMDAGDFHVELHEQRRPGDRDLLDLAATETFRHGGSVHVVGGERLSTATPARALLRFEAS